MRPGAVPPGLRAGNGNFTEALGVKSRDEAYPRARLELHLMRRVAISLSVLVLLSGCAAGASTPSAPPMAAGFALRAWTSQALPPVGAFPNAGPLFAIADGRLIVHGPVPAIYPGPLLPSLQQRSISQAGIAAIVDAARSAGLLDGPTDLTGGLAPGAQTAHLLFVIDGVEREVLGDPTRQIVCITTPCDGAPATPEAFGQFWSRIQDLQSWLGGELGAETPLVIDRLAVLLTEPVLDATLPPGFARWPLDGEMASFGVEWPGAPPARCGVVEGEDLATLLAAFRQANANTRWTDDTEAQFGVVARPLFPGEPDPCG